MRRPIRGKTRRPKHLIGANVDLLRRWLGAGVKVEVLYAGRRAGAGRSAQRAHGLLLDTPMQVEQLTALDYIHPPLQLNEYLVWTRMMRS
jgi:hypothetical protein